MEHQCISLEAHEDQNFSQESHYDHEGQETKQEKLVRYSIEDAPPWYLCLLLGFQHYLTMFGSTITVPLIISEALCVGQDLVVKSEIIGTVFFVSGLATLLQSTVGIRLPIIQSSTFSFLVPTFAILNMPRWKCLSSAEDSGAAFNTSGYTHENLTSLWTNFNSSSRSNMTNDLYRITWKTRMREIQGAVIVASLFQVAVGLTGVVGVFLRFIGPLAITPTISLIGLGLFGYAADVSSKHWWIAIMTIALVLMFSQYLKNIKVPCVSYSRSRKCHVIKSPIFMLFPIILGMCTSWFICAILTVTNVLPATGWGSHARTDKNLRVLREAKWIRFPYPGQWGMPTVSASSVLGMLAGVLASIMESLGDYYACARLSGAPPPPINAVNRGIFMEGIGGILAGLWGTGNGVTSYSENVGAIGITKVASRRVVQAAAVLMLLLGMLGKFGALFVTIPQPVLGGLFMVMFGMVSAVGLSNLQFVNLNSSRNLCIVGFSIVFGLALPKWVEKNPGVIKTGSEIVDQIFTVLLSTGMFVGGATGMILDNTIPGSDEERGLTKWNKNVEKPASEAGQDDCTSLPLYRSYHLPFGMKYIRGWKWTRYIPICPTFTDRRLRVGCRRKIRNKSLSCAS